MSTLRMQRSRAPAGDARRSWAADLARRIVLARLTALERGKLVVVDGRETLSFGDDDNGRWPAAAIRVHDRRFFADLLLGGSIGAGESFIQGRWTSNDLTSVMRIVALNRELGERLERGLARLRFPLQKLIQLRRRNSRRGSRRNIEAHYDLGNDFFSTFLDSSMMYSCAVFGTPAESLEKASRRKLDLICQKLALGPRDRVIEIGTGWGGFALHAAARYGCRVVTTTISRRQREWATEQVRRSGLQDRVTVLDCDYRDLPRRAGGERFDKLVSIEMIEAVGYRNFPTFFRTCADLLKPDGAMLLQAIVIQDQLYDAYRKSVDFIQRYVFPGGCLPSIEAIGRNVARHTDMRIIDLHDITPHYARTIRAWRERFTHNLGEVRALGYSEELIRLWLFYLSYCEGGFLERSVGDVQVVLSKPLNRVDAITRNS